MCAAKGNVRFTPNSDRESRHPQTVMSALPPTADMCGALAHVCYGPKADIAEIRLVELIVQTDAHEVVGQMCADLNETEGFIAKAVMEGAEVHVEVFDFPGHSGVGHIALYPCTRRPTDL